MKKHFYPLLLLWLVATGLVSCEDSLLDPTTHVSGVILDDFTGQPLAGVLVQLTEDNDGPFMGSKVIREGSTDQTGRYDFTFEWKEDPFKVTVSKAGYGYQRYVHSNLTNTHMLFDFQAVEPLKKKQSLDFRMEALGSLHVTLKNQAPAAGSDVLSLTISNLRREEIPAQARVVNGAQDIMLPELAVAGNRYVRFKYTVTEGGVSRSLKDSLYVLPGQANHFILTY